MNFIKRYGLLMALTAVVGLIVLLQLQPQFKEADYVKSYQDCLRGLEAEAQSGLDSLVAADQGDRSGRDLNAWQNSRLDLFAKKGIVYLIYDNDSLIFWTNHGPAVENYRKQVCLDNALARLRNGWFEVIAHPANKSGTKTYLALILLKNEYSYQNKYLVSEFPNRFGLPSQTQLLDASAEKLPNTIYASNGTPLFRLSILPDNANSVTYPSVVLAAYTLLILLIIFSIRQFAFTFFSSRKKHIQLFIFITMLLLLRFLMLIFNFPEPWQKTSFFDSRIYGNASSRFFGHLGDVVLNAVLLCYISIAVTSLLKQGRKIARPLFSFALVLTLAFAFSLLVNWLVTNLVQNSHLSFRINEIFSLSLQSCCGFLSLALMVFAIYSMTELAVHFSQLQGHNLKKIYFLLFLGWILHAFISIFFSGIDAISETWFWPLSLMIYLLTSKKIPYSFSYGIPFVILFSLVFGFLFFNEESSKEIEMRKVYAQDLSNRQDDVAENLFLDIAAKIKSDGKLKRMINSFPVNSLDVEQRLRQEYFSGYWEKFDVLLSLVDSTCAPLLSTDNPVHGNNTYFDQQIEQAGNKTLSDELFFIDNSSGRPRYIARVKLTDNSNQDRKPAVLYAQLEPKLSDNLTGFPELLLDKKVRTNTKLSEYAIAIYENKKRVGREGKFNYPSILDWNVSGEISVDNREGFSHVIHTSGKTQVILSKPNDKRRVLIAFFTFFFTFFSLLLLLVLVFYGWNFRKRSMSNSLNARIQLLLVAILLIALFSFGYGTYTVMRTQYENQSTDALEKLSKSIRSDVEVKLGNAQKLDDNYREFATYQLKKVAGVFLSDVSIYDLKGNLIASSQPRLFDEGIISRKMNPIAFALLQDSSLSTPIIYDESIGILNFKSSYQPFFNSQGKRIGFINLPYFARREQQQKEITLAVSPLVNIYVLLFTVAVLSALLIANWVTKPLRLLQQRFSSVRFGRGNEMISWNAKDEIGSLVDEYNRMVLQLEESAALLAKSEREGAWREMARQVAHEIKNPLTPMKLNIQQLQRTLGITQPNELPQKIQTLTAMLIEQIDTLSAIASEFSTFAQMPKANLEPLLISDTTRSCVQLFEGNSHYSISFNDVSDGNLQVMADKDQFRRMLTNLIKNAIQAIPQEKSGSIQITIIQEEKSVILRVEDNGVGIPPALHEKIFSPNFSTKSDGMGLGLAMVKNIVESINGTIRFETKVNEGTLFTIEIPKISNA